LEKIKKILISQPNPDSEKSPYFDICEKYGVKIDFYKFIRIEGVSSKEYRESKVRILDHSGVIFTSKVAIDHFFRICEESRITIPDDMKYFCVTESIALYLQRYIVYRKRKIFFGQKTFDDLLEIIKLKHNSGKLLLTLSDSQTDEITQKLDAYEINYSNLVLYHTVSCDLKELDLIKGGYDMFILFSPAGVKALFENFPEFKQDEIKLGTFGASTYKAAIDAGLRVDIKAPNPEFPSMTMALDRYLYEFLKNNKKKC
jgi:uroporphyrinogen-III synthase